MGEEGGGVEEEEDHASKMILNNINNLISSATAPQGPHMHETSCSQFDLENMVCVWVGGWGGARGHTCTRPAARSLTWRTWCVWGGEGGARGAWVCSTLTWRI